MGCGLDDLQILSVLKGDIRKRQGTNAFPLDHTPCFASDDGLQDIRLERSREILSALKRQSQEPQKRTVRRKCFLRGSQRMIIQRRIATDDKLQKRLGACLLETVLDVRNAERARECGRDRFAPPDSQTR
jgi:hypothetical protein